MIAVAAYDIARDDRRSRVAALLQAHGERIQKSVFVLDTSADTLATLRARIEGIVDLDEDSVYFMAQCGKCWGDLVVIGQAERPSKVLHWAVW